MNQGPSSIASNGRGTTLVAETRGGPVVGEPIPFSEDSVGYYIKRAEQAIVARKADVLRSLDLTVAQCMALGFLLDGTGKSCTQMAREAMVTSQTMTGIVQNLETKGLVERRTSPDHGRVQLISLTPQGSRIAAEARRLTTGIEDELANGLSTREHATLVRLMSRVTELARGAGWG
jgi:DNA-binding MarR family transcriptional regulator